MILLEIDGPTMLWLLDEPSRDNDFGRVGDTRRPAAALAAGLPGADADLRGWRSSTQTAPLESVIESILSLTEPAVPHRQ